jgi:hypothetical protein
LRKRAAIRRKVSPAEAVRFRKDLVARLGAIAPNWSAMPDADLSRLLIGQGITTATGLRFDPDRAREFRRSLAKVEAKDPFASDNPAVVAEAMRLVLLEAIAELRGPIPDERRTKIEGQVRLIGLVLCEDRFADHTVLHKALDIAERAVSRT